MALARRHRPDLVLVHATRPEIDAVEMTRRLTHQDGSLRVVILAGLDDPALQVAAVRAGAVGFVAAQAGTSAIHRAARGLAGDDAIARSLAVRLVEELSGISCFPEGGPRRSRVGADQPRTAMG